MSYYMVYMKKTTIIVLFVAAVLFSSCSINKLAMDAVSDVLGGTEGGNVFTADNDPQLVKDALPFSLKLYETLLQKSPDHTGLLLNTGMGFIMYANAFVHTPADMLPDVEYRKQEEMLERAKKLYLRGRDYIFRAIEVRHPGFMELVETENSGLLESALFKEMTKEDVPYLYWCSAGWFAAISVDFFDLDLSVGLSKASALMEKAYQLDPDFNDGMIHQFYILYYSSLPADMGGDEQKARYHFEKAVELSDGTDPTPYVSLATTLSIKNQNREEYVTLLEKALSIDPNADPDNRLLIIVMQDKARWYLDHIEDFFI
jgi:predicted anti-sigma-YlaC factor YlaD